MPPTPTTETVNKNYEKHQNNEDKMDVRIVYGAVAGVVSLAVVIIIVWIIFKKKRNQRQDENIDDNMNKKPDDDFYEQPVDNDLKYTGQQQPAEDDYVYANNYRLSSLGRQVISSHAEVNQGFHDEKHSQSNSSPASPHSTESTHFATPDDVETGRSEKNLNSINTDEPLYGNVSGNTVYSNADPFYNVLEDAPDDCPEYLTVFGSVKNKYRNVNGAFDSPQENSEEYDCLDNEDAQAYDSFNNRVPDVNGSMDDQDPEEYGSLDNEDSQAYGSLNNGVLDENGSVDDQDPDEYGSNQNDGSEIYGNQIPDVNGPLEDQNHCENGSLEKEELHVYGSLKNQGTHVYGSLIKQDPNVYTCSSYYDQNNYEDGSFNDQDPKFYSLFEGQERQLPATDNNDFDTENTGYDYTRYGGDFIAEGEEQQSEDGQQFSDHLYMNLTELNNIQD